MKKTLISIALMMGLSSPAFADTLHGTWKTAPDDNGNFGHISVKDCDGTICGTLVKSFDSSGKSVSSEHIGRLIIWEMKSDGGGKYSGGKIYSPDRDKTYKSKLELLSNDFLQVSGCVAFICRDGGVWERVK